MEKNVDEPSENNDEDSTEINLDDNSRGNPESWFLETGELSDVTVHCGRKTYRLHKCNFLSCRNYIGGLTCSSADVLCRESKWFLDRCCASSSLLY